MAKIICTLIWLLALMPSAMALEGDEPLANAALEERAVAIGQSLRCVVCEMQSVNDSPADMARDVRLLIREQLQQGQSDAAIMHFIQSRYGDSVLLQPPLQATTMLLWLAAPLLLLFGVVLLYRQHHKQGPRP